MRTRWIFALLVVSTPMALACGASTSSQDREDEAQVETSGDEGPMVGRLDIVVEPVSAEVAVERFDAAMRAARSASPEAEVYALDDGTELRMYRWQNVRLSLSEELCAPLGQLGTCAALDAVRDVQTVRVEIPHGTPASHFCLAIGGSEVRGTTDAGETGLCRFADGSYVSSWSLVHTPSAGRRLLEEAGASAE